MRQSLSILLAFTLLLISVTACSDVQKAAAPSGSETAQGTRQHNGGNMSRGERPAEARSAGGNYTEGAQREVRDSGRTGSGLDNDDNVDKNGAGNTITGKVKSIVGNEIVLIITQKTNTADKENSTDTSGAMQAESAGQEITATYLIPVGMAIGNKDFSSIKAGNTLKIYFGTDPSDNSEIITAVELR